jgi:hypothetical protein
MEPRFPFESYLHCHGRPQSEVEEARAAALRGASTDDIIAELIRRGGEVSGGFVSSLIFDGVRRHDSALGAMHRVATGVEQDRAEEEWRPGDPERDRSWWGIVVETVQIVGDDASLQPVPR